MAFSLSQSCGYAIRALACLADGTCTPRSARDVAACTGIPAPYLGKLLRKLVSQGLVVGKRGPGGGIHLARSGSRISLMDVAEAVDGPDVLGTCLLGAFLCDEVGVCPTKPFWDRTRPAIRAELARLSIADVLRFEKRHAARRPADETPPRSPPWA